MHYSRRLLRWYDCWVQPKGTFKVVHRPFQQLTSGHAPFVNHQGTMKPLTLNASGVCVWKNFIIVSVWPFSVKDTGITFHGHHLHVSVKQFVCDATARTFIKCTKGHNAYHGCEKCEQNGITVDCVSWDKCKEANRCWFCLLRTRTTSQTRCYVPTVPTECWVDFSYSTWIHAFAVSWCNA